MVVQYVPMICYAYPGIKAGAFAAIFYAYLIPIACTDVLFDATTRRFLDVRLTHSSVLLPVLLASSEVPRRYSPTPSLVLISCLILLVSLPHATVSGTDLLYCFRVWY